MDPQVKTALDKLEKSIDDVKKSSGKKPMFVTKDKHIEPLSSKTENKEDWIENIQKYATDRYDDEKDRVSFIYEKLDKTSKNEVSFSIEDLSKANTVEIIAVLKTLHCREPTYMQLQNQFHTRCQKRDETIDDYSQALIELFLKLRKLQPAIAKERDMILKEKLADGVADSQLRRELKRLNTERSTLKFVELRECARRWMDDSSKKTVRADETACSESSTGMMTLIKEQQEQIKQLTEAVAKLSAPQTQTLSYKENQMGRQSGDFRGRGYRYRGNYRRGNFRRGGWNGQRPQQQSDSDKKVEDTSKEAGKEQVDSRMCRYCGERNHYQRFCLKLKEDQKNQNMASQETADSMYSGLPLSEEEELRREVVFQRMVGRCPEITATFGGVPVKSLLDSGSEVTTVNEKFFYDQLYDFFTEDSSWVTVKGGNGLRIPCEGYFEVDITLLGRTYPKVVVLVATDPEDEPTRLRKRQVPGIIGCNLLEQIYSNCKEDFGANFIEMLKGKPGSEGLATALQAFATRTATCNRITAEITDSRSGQLGHVKLAGKITDPVCLPGNSGSVITGTTRQLPDGCTVLIEPSNDLNLPTGVIVYPTLATVEKGKVKIQMRNYNQQPVIIKQPHKVATVSACELMGSKLTVRQESSTSTRLVIDVQQNETSLEVDTRWVEGLQISDALTESEVKHTYALLERYKDVFSMNDDDVGHVTLMKHKITTTDNIPFRQPDRCIPPAIKPEVKKILEDWLKKGIIQESSSPYASQLVFAKKKNGQIRACVDYRMLNKKTVKDAFPLPRIEETMEQLKGSKYFCSLDLTQGYLQIEVDEEDRQKTAFRAFGHLYEFCRLPYGVCNGPATFSRMMSQCFGDMIENGVVLFLDDLLVHGKSFEEVLLRLETVFRKLRHFGLKLNSQKCQFFKEKVAYLGHVVSVDGIATDPDKIKAIVDIPVPDSEAKLLSFVSLCGYYRRFVKGFSSIAAPLYSLLTGRKKGKKSRKKTTDVPLADRWTPEAQRAFEQLKQALVTSPILGYPDFTIRFELEIDASMAGLGAVLSQKQASGPVVIAYASRALKKYERNMKNYSSMKLEFLGLHWSVTQKFRDYLYGSKFTVYTDSNPLSYILKSKRVIDISWLADLADFDFELIFKPGKKNIAADFLSRCITSKEIQEAANIETTSVTALPDRLVTKMYETREESTTTVLPDVRCCSSLPSYTTAELRSMQSDDSDIGLLLSYFKAGKKIPRRELIGKIVLRKMARKWNQFAMKDGILYRQITLNGETVSQLVLPDKLKQVVLEQLHDACGHQGIERTLSLVQSRCYWPSMIKDVEKHCKQCERCLISKERRPKLKVQMGHLIASEPADTIAIDFTVLEKSSSGVENVLVVTDIFTKYTQVYPCKDQKAKTVCKILLSEWFLKLGIPRRIHSDQGKSFENELILSLCKMFGVEKSRSSPYHPEGNSIVEPYNRTMHDLLKSLSQDKKRKWPEYIAELVYAYNATPHASTAFAPYFLFFGRRPRLHVDTMLNFPVPEGKGSSLEDWVQERLDRMETAYQRAMKRLNMKAQERKRRHDKTVPKQCPLKPGGKVLLRNRVKGRNKIQDVWNPVPFVIVERVKNTSAYKVRAADRVGEIKVVNRVDLLDVEQVDDTSKEGSMSENDESSSEEELMLVNDVQDLESVAEDENIEEDETDVQGVEEVEEEAEEEVTEVVTQPLRKSTRKTAGKHSNPHHLPKSVLQQSVKVESNDFAQFSSAVRDLGETLGKVLLESYLSSKK